MSHSCRILPALVLTALLAAPALAARDGGAIPARRGPLTRRQALTLIREVVQPLARPYHEAATSALAARRAGRPFRSPTFDVDFASEAYGPGAMVIVAKGAKGKLGDGPGVHAVVSGEETIHVQVNVLRREPGKRSPTLVTTKLSPGMGAHGGTLAYLVETRDGAVNGTTPAGRSTMRTYDSSLRWTNTVVDEHDGWGNRAGHPAGHPAPVTHYAAGRKPAVHRP